MQLVLLLSSTSLSAGTVSTRSSDRGVGSIPRTENREEKTHLQRIRENANTMPCHDARPLKMNKHWYRADGKQKEKKIKRHPVLFR